MRKATYCVLTGLGVLTALILPLNRSGFAQIQPPCKATLNGSVLESKSQGYTANGKYGTLSTSINFTCSAGLQTECGQCTRGEFSTSNSSAGPWTILNTDKTGVTSPFSCGQDYLQYYNSTIGPMSINTYYRVVVTSAAYAPGGICQGPNGPNGTSNYGFAQTAVFNGDLTVPPATP